MSSVMRPEDVRAYLASIGSKPCDCESLRSELKRAREELAQAHERVAQLTSERDAARAEIADACSVFGITKTDPDNDAGLAISIALDKFESLLAQANVGVEVLRAERERAAKTERERDEERIRREASDNRVTALESQIRAAADYLAGRRS